MSFIDDLRDQWDEMDDTDKTKIKTGIVFCVLILIALYTINNTLNVVGGYMDQGIQVANNSVSNLPNFTQT